MSPTPLGIVASGRYAAPAGGGTGDDFNRTNGAVGSAWGFVYSGTAHLVDTNQVKAGGAGTNHQRFGTISGSADQAAEIKMTVAGAIGVGVRMGASTETGYIWRYNGTECTLFRVTAGSFSSIGTAYTATLSANDVLRIEAHGSKIRGYVNGKMRAWADDATHSAAGYPSLRIGDTTVRGDDFVSDNVMHPVSVIEEQFTTNFATGPQAVTFAQPVLSGDRVLVLYGCHRASSIRFISSISGMGGTWASLVTHIGQISAWLGTGVTAPGTVTITQNSAFSMTAHLYLIRGLTSSTVSSTTANLAGGTLEGPTVSAAFGQFVASWMCATDPTLANTTQFPGAHLPSTGWDDNAVIHNGVNAFGSAWRIPTEQPAVTHRSQAQIGSGDAGYIGTLALGTAA